MTDFDDALYKQISDSILQRYSARFSELGNDVRSLGWGSAQQQRARFANITRVAEFSNNSVIDIGCGFGDLLKFFTETGVHVTDYHGWDINPAFINEACKLNPDHSHNFFVKDLLNETIKHPVANIGVMLGLLNYNYCSRDVNINFTKSMMHKAFELVDKFLVVDFLSSQLDLSYPKESFVFYHDPAEVLSYCLSLTSNLQVFHDYTPIPQKEFTVVLFK